MNFYKNWIAYWTIVKSGLCRVFRLWPQTLVPPVITSFLYFSIFGHVIGSRVGEMEGFTYAAFIAPGLIMMQVIMSAYSGTVSTFFMAKFHRDIEELLVSPMSNFSILLAYASIGVFRGVLTGILVTGVAMCFTEIYFYSFATILLISIVSSAIFSLAGLINAVYARNFDDISIIPNFVLTPLTYFGGVFYSVNALPEKWRFISYINPIYYIIHAFRYGFLGAHYTHLGLSIGLISIFLVGLFLIAWAIFKSGAGLRS